MSTTGSGRRGFTLVEVIVALVLLTVGLLAALSMTSLAARTLGEARRISLAAAAAESLADSLVGAPGGAGDGAGWGTREHDWGVLRWEPGERAGEVRIVARAWGAGGDGGGTPEEGTEAAILFELWLRLPPAAAEPAG